MVRSANFDFYGFIPTHELYVLFIVGEQLNFGLSATGQVFVSYGMKQTDIWTFHFISKIHMPGVCSLAVPVPHSQKSLQDISRIYLRKTFVKVIGNLYNIYNVLTK